MRSILLRVYVASAITLPGKKTAMVHWVYIHSKTFLQVIIQIRFIFIIILMTFSSKFHLACMLRVLMDQSIHAHVWNTDGLLFILKIKSASTPLSGSFLILEQKKTQDGFYLTQSIFSRKVSLWASCQLAWNSWPEFKAMLKLNYLPLC